MVRYCSLVLLVVMFVFAGCKKTETVAPAPVFTSGYNVYMAGTNHGNAVYWKNADSVTLDSTANGLAIAVSGSDVYVSGVLYQNNNDNAVYWKNGQRFQLVGSGISYATGIGIQGTDVYCAGYLFGPANSGIVHAVYWKNGVVTTLSPFTNAVAQSILVTPSQIYISGQVYANGWDTAVVWKNGVQTYYGEPGNIYAMTLSPTDTIFAGNFGSGAAYWTHDSFKQYNNAFAGSVAAQGNDIYIGGGTFASSGLSQAAYWKNDIITLLPNTYKISTVNGIAIAGDDVYAVGSVQDDTKTYPVFWKNGVMQLRGTDGEVRAIVITPQ
jgi:hypothetical protein